ncbi:MAG: hypothetical protein Q7U76_11160 [Nitrospirota bacterium]|nr:hypothetical protein [Nitrospirota bacterium]
MNQWILRSETADKKGFEFLNAIRDHAHFVLEPVQIRQFDAPDKLVLRGQVVLKDASVIFEPFHPKPVSPFAPTPALRLYLEGADENGSPVITSPTFEALRFCVKNVGEQTIRDYRNTVFIPQAFRRPSSESYIDNLSKQDEVMIGEQEYVVYGNFISNPIYKYESIRIGQLILQADPGEYTLLWKIHCDDGIFPTEETYGQIKLRVIHFGGLVDRAFENLYKKP